MSDLISRQQAIDTIEDFPHGDVWNVESMEEMVDRIKQLPSAQPDIIRCKDCDWWTKQEDSPQGRCALLQMYPTGGWFCGNARRREVTT